MATAAIIVVRVQSHNGKFFGDDIGGAQVSIRDVRTWKLLAEGVTRGDNGLLSARWSPGARLSTVITDGGSPEPIWLTAGPKTAAFAASLDIAQPTVVEIAVYGPLAGLGSAVRATTQQAVVPGQRIEDVVLQVQGLVVQIMSPPTHAVLSGPQATVTLTANVTLMCGCPISTEPLGSFSAPLWPPSDFEVDAMIREAGERSYTRVPLAYVPRSTSRFSATYTVPRPGNYEATIVARQPRTGNAGLGRVAWIARGGAGS